MLEALVDLCRGGTHTNRDIGTRGTGNDEAGDIICVKRQPCVWGSQEKKEQIIIILKDDNLTFTDLCTLPYANDENRSFYKVDVSRFSQRVLDYTKISRPQKPMGKQYFELSDLIFNDNPR